VPNRVAGDLAIGHNLVWPTIGVLRMRAALLVLLLLAVAPGFGARPAVAGNPPIHSYAIVQDDATLRVQGKTIRLFGLHIPSSSRGCVTILRPVRCGSRAVRALELKIQGFVECVPQLRHRDGSISAICYVEEGSILDPPVDLGAWLIEQGFAVARPEAPFEYGVLEEIARVNRRGLWGFQVDRIR
jgi:endonuclease YncB( thermonuclease family)